MGRPAAAIILSDEERGELQRWRRSGRSGLYVRAGIVLDCAAGLSGAEIASSDEPANGEQVAGLPGSVWRVCPMRRAAVSVTAMSGFRRSWMRR